MEQKKTSVIVVDGSNHILGRLASIIAKKLLNGERIVVVNAEKIVVSGKPSEVVKQYKATVLPVRSHHQHKWRPKRPRSPVRLFKSAVKGMLPKNNKRGRDALSRLRVYVGVPKEFEGAELVRFREADASRLARGYVELGRIARELGWKGEVE